MNDIQKCILKIFKQVAAICDKNGIPYYAIGGTCIGAVRHKGFIPWDDDLDIAVPIEHFDRLRKILEEELPECYKVYDCQNNNFFPFFFSKVHDVRTAFIEDEIQKFPEAYKGVFVDIMPLSGVPFGKRKKELFILKLSILSVLNNVRRYPLCAQNSYIGKVASIILKLPLSIFDNQCFSNCYLNQLRKYPMNNSKSVAYVWSPKHLRKWTFSRTWFDNTTRLPFEDTTINCPYDYDSYLKEQFGEYMIPPPREEQSSPHRGIIDLERSFREYQNRKF